MIKTLLIIALAISPFTHCFCQKRGYKELLIGASIEVIFENRYISKSIEKNGSGDVIKYMVINAGFEICDLPVEYVMVHTDASGDIIKTVQVVTKELEIKNSTDYLNNIKTISSILIDNVGRPVVVDTNPPAGGNITMGWDFKEERIIFVMAIENMSTFAENEKRRVFFTWSKSETKKMW